MMGTKAEYDSATQSIIDKSNSLIDIAVSTTQQSTKKKRRQTRKIRRKSDNHDDFSQGDYQENTYFLRPNSSLGRIKEEDYGEELGAVSYNSSADERRRPRPRTTDGITTGFSNMYSPNISGNAASTMTTSVLRGGGRNVRTAEGIQRPKIVEFNETIATMRVPDIAERPTSQRDNTGLKRVASHNAVLVSRKPTSAEVRQFPSRPSSMGILLPADWNNRRVNQESANLASAPSQELTKNEWENEIARHILSLYATTKASVREDVNQGKSIISFVDNKRPDSAALVTMKDDVFLSSPLRPEDWDKDYLRDISLHNTERVATASGGSRVQTAPGENRVHTASGRSRGPSRGAPVPSSNGLESGFTALISEEGFNFANSSPSKAKVASAYIKRLSTPERVKTAATSSSQPKLPALTNSGSRANTRDSSRRPPSRAAPMSIHKIPIVLPIWFVSSGDVHVDWSSLPGGQKLQLRLTALYDQGKYLEYISVLELMIGDIWSLHSTRVGVIEEASMTRSASVSIDVQNKKSRAGSSVDGSGVGGRVFSTGLYDEIPADKVGVLWKQLITATNAISILALEKRNFVTAHDLLKIAEKLCKKRDLLSPRDRKEMKAIVADTLAYYFFKRQKMSTALTYTEKALEIYESIGNNDAIAICLLHISAIQSCQGIFKESHKNIYQFIAMVEDGSLAFEAATPQQLCLVAVCYHNLAVVQLKLEVPDLACKSSQNARKLARLCLSFSNRWIDTFQKTHETALECFKEQLSSAVQGMEEYQRFCMDELADSLMN